MVHLSMITAYGLCELKLAIQCLSCLHGAKERHGCGEQYPDVFQFIIIQVKKQLLLCYIETDNC